MMAAPRMLVPPPADVVGYAFASQYYLLLHQSPELVYKFYQDVSKLGRPEEGGVMSTTTTMLAINEKILSLGYGQYQAEIITVDSQESYKGGVLVLVTGYLTGTNYVRKKFTQSFFLAPQEKGYFVLNDVFRYVDNPMAQNPNDDLANGVEIPFDHHQDPPPDEVIVESGSLSEEVNGEVYDSPDNADASVEEQGVSVPEEVDEFLGNSLTVTDPGVEEIPKQSYAAIVMRDTTIPSSSSMPSLVRSAPKGRVNKTAAMAFNVSSVKHESNSATIDNGSSQEAEGSSIYIKRLPLDATPALLENEFKKFGPIRPNGIQVRFQKEKGFCFGFVEFEASSSAQSALEASPIMINGCRVVVEEKRSTYRGNYRARISSGSGGGYRNEGVRGGRGSFGGSKSYNHGDFGNRAEFGSRSNGRGGGFSNRRGEVGYWRTTERMGSNGSSRGHHTSWSNLNAAPKSVSPTVPATA